jgi:excinuclease UvrABC nuclease subunit
MPFDRFTPQSLTVPSVRANAPALSGIYGISNAHEWIYIGEASNIQAALLGHLQQSDSALMKRRPTGFVFEVCDPAVRFARQDRLVFEYEPVCNRMPQVP